MGWALEEPQELEAFCGVFDSLRGVLRDDHPQWSPGAYASQFCQLGYLPSINSSPAVGPGHEGG